MIYRGRFPRLWLQHCQFPALRLPSITVYICSNQKHMVQSLGNMPLMSSGKQTDILRAIKALRRSIKGEEKAKAHISIGPKSAVAIVPPKKVRSLSTATTQGKTRNPS
jgi:hypothetical protein